MKKRLIRYPHGFFNGGIWDYDFMPTITTSSWEWNNLLLEIDDDNGGTRKQKPREELR